MMEIVIIEDETQAAEHLERLIGRQRDDIRLVATLPSVKKAVSWFGKNQSPDLVFMDIQLSDGICFSIFEEVEISSPIIFTTAYDKYALKAFKVNSIDYLLKPIDPEDLRKAFEKLFQLTRGSIGNQKITKDQIQNLLQAIQPPHKRRFAIKVGHHLRSVQTGDIDLFVSDNKLTYLVQADARRYPVDYTLSQLEDLLDPDVFFRINRKYIVHRNSIVDIVSYGNSRLKVKLTADIDDEIIVSRERVQAFRNWLDL